MLQTYHIVPTNNVVRESFVLATAMDNSKTSSESTFKPKSSRKYQSREILMEVDKFPHTRNYINDEYTGGYPKFLAFLNFILGVSDFDDWDIYSIVKKVLKTRKFPMEKLKILDLFQHRGMTLEKFQDVIVGVYYLCDIFPTKVIQNRFKISGSDLNILNGEGFISIVYRNQAERIAGVIGTGDSNSDTIATFEFRENLDVDEKPDGTVSLWGCFGDGDRSKLTDERLREFLHENYKATNNQDNSKTLMI